MKILQIKISGIMELEKELEMGQEVTLTIKAEVVKIEDYATQDESEKKRFILKAKLPPNIL